MTPVAKRPVVFTPMKGALSIARTLAEHFGVSQLFEGEDGIEGVLRQKLKELGVPEKPVELNGAQGMTVRQMAEESGFIKRARPHRRVK